jgi:hypothetical protein
MRERVRGGGGSARGDDEGEDICAAPSTGGHFSCSPKGVGVGAGHDRPGGGGWRRGAGGRLTTGPLRRRAPIISYGA